MCAHVYANCIDFNFYKFRELIITILKTDMAKKLTKKYNH